MNESPLGLLAGLADAGVDFVVIGAIAVIAHGHVRTTRDVDITYATEQPNLDLLGQVLVDLDARLRGVAEVVPFVPDRRTLHGAEILTLETTHGALDLLASPPGAPPYAELKERAETIDVEGRSVAIASLDDLVAMKRAAGRPRDLEDIQALEELRRLQAEEGQT
jgi:predicted nucleotidyltransferase